MPTIAEPAPRGLALVAPAALSGVACALVLGAAALGSGLIPTGVAGAVWVGLGAGLVTGTVGVCIKAWALTRRADDPMVGQALQVALLGDFLLQLVVVGLGALLGTFVLHLKFPVIAGFCLAFAAVALGYQLASTAVLVRTHRRFRNASGGAGQSADPDASATGVEGHRSRTPDSP